ncbi:MAG: alpha/beta fold hydrolase [Actinomycetota bacterium]|nr:alpha/beta fold hydrolase [Actinomycetota bacterium]
MITILVAILLLIVVFVAASLVLSRATHEVGSARDTEYLELEGDWIRYSVTGGGPPVVLVHGWLSSSRIWDLLVARLARNFTVYTLDLSGFGDSDKPISGYGVRNGSRLLYAFCAHFGLTHAAVVGHDLGGAMATKLTADHPDLVSRLVLVATPADEDQIDLPTLLWLATLPVIGSVFYTLGRFWKPLRRLWMRPFVLDPEDLTEEVVDDAGKSTPAALSKTLGVTRREISRGRLVRQAGIIKVPILVIAGEEDQIVDPQGANEWARTLSAEVVFLNECGHLPMLERTGEFNAQVLAFLTGDPSHLDAIPEPPEEMTAEDVAEAPEEPSPPTRSEPASPEPGTTDPGEPPTVTRKRYGGYPPRDRDPGRVEANRSDAPDPTADQHLERFTPTEGDDAEKRPRFPGGSGDDAIVPDLPENLFEWPDSLKESRPWSRPHETDRQAQEERSEGADPEDPENGPRS